MMNFIFFVKICLTWIWYWKHVSKKLGQWCKILKISMCCTCKEFRSLFSGFSRGAKEEKVWCCGGAAKLHRGRRLEEVENESVQLWHWRSPFTSGFLPTVKVAFIWRQRFANIVDQKKSFCNLAIFLFITCSFPPENLQTIVYDQHCENMHFFF